MSSAILRRNSSKQGLQNLLRVTAQRSIEDAEEVERERRRRARESFRRGSNTSGPGGSSQNNGSPNEDGLYDSDLKPGGSSPSLEEDEGFSDWTQRLERRRQQRMEELGQGQETEEASAADGAAGTPERATAVAVTAAAPACLQVRSTEEEKREESLTRDEREKRRKGGREEPAGEERAQREAEREKNAEKQRVQRIKREEEDQGPEVGTKIKGKEVKVSYMSKVFVNQKVKHNGTNGNAPKEDMVKTKRTLRPALQAEAGEAEEAEAILETELKLEKIRRSHQEKESQELEQLRQKQVEAEQELEQLRRRREARRGVRQEEERRREEEEQQRLAKEEEEKRRMKEDIERRRMEAAERMKTLSTSTVDGDEIFSPLSPKGPTFKRENEEGLTAENTSSITERTESLNRSLKKSNSFKKTQPPVLLSKIDDKLEQYTHAIETSQETKAAKQAPTDIIGPPEAVASKKNLFEAGEAWSQTPTKGTPCKEAEGLKVGVADLITQWVKGSPDGSAKQSLAKPSDVRPGDVMQKKNMWEIIGEESSGRPGHGTRVTSSGKKFKFVVTGHGKYEKSASANQDGNEYTNDNGKSDLCSADY